MKQEEQRKKQREEFAMTRKTITSAEHQFATERVKQVSCCRLWLCVTPCRDLRRGGTLTDSVGLSDNLMSSLQQRALHAALCRHIEALAPTHPASL